MVLSFGAQVGGVLSFWKLGLMDRLPASLKPIVKAVHRNVSFTSSVEVAR